MNAPTSSLAVPDTLHFLHLQSGDASSRHTATAGDDGIVPVESIAPLPGIVAFAGFTRQNPRLAHIGQSRSLWPAPVGRSNLKSRSSACTDQGETVGQGSGKRSSSLSARRVNRRCCGRRAAALAQPTDWDAVELHLTQGLLLAERVGATPDLSSNTFPVHQIATPKGRPRPSQRTTGPGHHPI